MFRFLGLIWDPAGDAANAAARRLGTDVWQRANWESVVDSPGLQVFVAGAHEGTNQVYRLDFGGVVLGKLFRHGEAGQGPAPAANSVIEDSSRILQSNGRELVQRYWGRYVGFLRGQSGIVCVMRDPSGALPCCLMRHEGVSIVFSFLEDVIDLMPSLPRPCIRWEALAAQLQLGEPCGRETALEGVTQLVPGEAVHLGSGDEHHTLVWNPAAHARAVATENLTEAANLLRQTARLCVRSWASCYSRLLLRLSGGVDSSILLACLTQDRIRADVLCLNYHSPGANSDERSYARLAAARSDRVLVERERVSSVRLEPVLGIARMPSPTSYVGRLGTARMDADVASAHRAPAMFTGGGGDQLFFELHQWWPAADYLRLHGFDAGLLPASMSAARLGRLSIWRTLQLAIKDRLRSGQPAVEAGADSTLANPDALEAGERESYEHPVLRDAVDLPIGKLTQLALLLAHGGYYDPFERDRAPELVNPFLSQPLIELCLALPTYVLAHGGRGRALARQAFACDLPVEIATRRTKGGMSDHVKSLLSNNLDFARSLLLDGELVGRGLLIRHKVEEALSRRPSAVVSNVVEIHDLIAIEAWIQRWNS